MGKTLPDLQVMETENILMAMMMTKMMSVVMESLDHFTTLT